MLAQSDSIKRRALYKEKYHFYNDEYWPEYGAELKKKLVEFRPKFIDKYGIIYGN
jgi:hypothetical protein